jgi:glycosyltransferase involved in cell wall biosynthesis
MHVVQFESFGTGSHHAAHDSIKRLVGDRADSWSEIVGPGTKVHWHLVAGSLWAADEIQRVAEARGSVDCLLIGGTVNLAEILGILSSRGIDCSGVRTVYYMHEAQAAYPSTREDTSAIWAQLSSAAAATVVAFASEYAARVWAEATAAWLRRISVAPMRRAAERALASVAAHSLVLPLPVEVAPSLALERVPPPLDTPLAIVWNHRWEHDKRPDTFVRVLLALHTRGLAFTVDILGQTFSSATNDADTAAALETLRPYIRRQAYLPSRDAYLSVLAAADVAVSTADHEFFGLAMLEATLAGAHPLCPDRLAYPTVLEVPKRGRDDFFYRTEAQLTKKLAYFARSPAVLRSDAFDRRRADLRTSLRSAIGVPGSQTLPQRWADALAL